MYYPRQKFSPERAQKGFSLVEVILGASLFAIISLGIYQSYATLTTLVGASRVKIIAADLANERLELVRNLPYSSVGLVGGIPSGVLNPSETFIRSGQTFYATTTIRNIDDPFDGTLGGSPNDLSPADYKLVEITLNCPTCKNFTEMSVATRVAPKNLETSSTNGALFVKVFDANGVPIQGANVSVVNTQVTPAINIDDVTNAQGMLQIVDAPPGANAYQITVTKFGFTTDQTHATSTENPNPSKPHATVVTQQVTQISFIIDELSSLNITPVNLACAPISGASATLTGSKLIGTSPDVYKYSQSHSLPAGTLSLSNMEWDTYNLSLSGGLYLFGVNPLLPITLLPNATQDVQLVVTSASPRILLVTVKDNVTGLPLSGAEVLLSKDPYSETLTTGRGFLSQTDWSGGGGQETIGDLTRYSSSDGNIEFNSPAGDIRLSQVLGSYSSSGNLTSSTFDSGTTSNFYQISWSPTAQPPQTGTPNVRFQLASNNDGSTWNFVGPDGTSGSYYTTSDANLSSVHNDTRYFRYKVWLDTADTNHTPNISDAAFTFTSACIPPGQVSFSGLSGGTYNISASLPGYATHNGTVDVSGNWQEYQINLYPE